MRHELVKTRKPHRCWGCWQQFPAGSILYYSVGVYDGDFGTAYWCQPCDAYINEHREDFEDGISPGAFRGEPDYEQFKQAFYESGREIKAG